jgi:four helix bundle protein
MKKELEKRLIAFSVMIINAVETIKNSTAGIHLCDQVIRSGTSSALNYGEAQSAESRKDFLHKISVVLKELRETNINLEIIRGAGLSNDNENLIRLLDESEQLIKIFQKTISTIKKNNT